MQSYGEPTSHDLAGTRSQSTAAPDRKPGQRSRKAPIYDAGQERYPLPDRYHSSKIRCRLCRHQRVTRAVGESGEIVLISADPGVGRQLGRAVS
jgi:hypothetical protein